MRECATSKGCAICSPELQYWGVLLCGTKQRRMRYQDRVAVALLPRSAAQKDREQVLLSPPILLPIPYALSVTAYAMLLRSCTPLLCSRALCCYSDAAYAATWCGTDRAYVATRCSVLTERAAVPGARSGSGCGREEAQDSVNHAPYLHTRSLRNVRNWHTPCPLLTYALSGTDIHGR